MNYLELLEKYIEYKKRFLLVFPNDEQIVLRQFAMWLNKDAAQQSVQADGAESLEPQWICMTCKTVIGPVVDDGEHRCNCKDDYLIELWRVAPVVESPRR